MNITQTPIVPETPYVETEMLLAVMNGNHDGAVELIQGMLPRELQVFSDQLRFASELVHRRQRAGWTR